MLPEVKGQKVSGNKEPFPFFPHIQQCSRELPLRGTVSKDSLLHSLINGAREQNKSTLGSTLTPPWSSTLRTRVVPNKGICQTRGGQVSGFSWGSSPDCCPGRTQRPDLLWITCLALLLPGHSPVQGSSYSWGFLTLAAWPCIRQQPFLGLPAPVGQPPAGPQLFLGLPIPAPPPKDGSFSQGSLSPGHWLCGLPPI